MEFLLIRHAEPEWVKDGLSIVNPPLTKRGFDQAERLGERLAEEH
ncbi:MAG: histidine phosphatase family protein, partial [Ilumatobacteraceae bacterium]